MLLAWIVLLPCAARADIEPSAQDPDKPISFSADQANRWQDGEFEVWWLRGHIEVSQAEITSIGDEAILWIKRDGELQERVTRLTSYIEGEVTVSQGPRPKPGERPQNGIQDRRWIYTFYSTLPPQNKIPTPGAEPAKKPAILDRALALRAQKLDDLVRQAQYVVPDPAQAPPPDAVRLPPITNTIPPSAVIDPNAVPPGALPPGALPPGAVVVPPALPAPNGPRKLDFYPRSRVPYQVDIVPTPGTNETILTLRNGVTMIVDNVPGQGTLDLAADNMVVWTAGITALTGSVLQAQDVPLEVYMEGNIVFRQGERKIYASRMYYNVQQQVGVILNTEIISDAPKFAGKMRLRADVVQQTGPGQFLAKHAFVTSSRMAKPGYRLQAGTIEYVDREAAAVDPLTGEARPPAPGMPAIETDRLLTSRNNLAFIGPVPVFYWPVFKSDLEESSFFIRNAKYKSDRIFGQQFYLTLNPFQLFGIKRRPGTDWSVSVDYFSKRGPAVGTAYKWQGPDFFGLQGPVRGFVDAWAIHDTGLDTLGSDRVNLLPEPARDPRGRALGRQRQYLPGGFVVTGQIGWISDRNFLEQYFENEWDRNPDYITDLELKRFRDNTSWSVLGSVRLNDWFTQTQWLPKADHFWLGQPLLGDRLSWFEHSSAGYANMKIAAQPTDPSEIAKFTYLPWENNVKGGRYFTTQEIDFPFTAGAVNVVPYGLGQLAHWDQDLSGNSVNRAYGQVGVRASIPFWATNPTYESTLFNVHGLAHKVLFEADANWADSNQDMTQLPLYDPIDDDNLEAFNRRFTFNTFGSPLNPPNARGIPVPPKWDPRYYAIRSGLGSSVTSASPELLQSLTAIRLNLRQRWQTKRGLPTARHIIDWITFDTGVSIFPQPDRDNFGQVIGLANYQFNWHVGDRVTLLSDGIFDFFQGGQKIVTVGAFLNRPPRGSLYVGFHSLNGPVVPGVLTPFNNQVLLASYSYRMSPKWVSGAGLSYNLAGKNIGENLTLTRIGESFLVSMGVNSDVSKNNFGFTFMIEPRFMPRTMLGRVGGAQIPLAGKNGLE